MLLQFLKKSCLLFLISLLLVTSCSNNKSIDQKQSKHSLSKTARGNAPDTASENFILFFKRFSTDSVFQTSRIKFPIKLTIIGGEGESDTIKFIEKKDWWFAHVLPGKDIVTMPRQTDKTTAHIHFYIDDTGFSVYYYFVNRGGKWWMNSIRDESD